MCTVKNKKTGHNYPNLDKSFLESNIKAILQLMYNCSTIPDTDAKVFRARQCWLLQNFPTASYLKQKAPRLLIILWILKCVSLVQFKSHQRSRYNLIKYQHFSHDLENSLHRLRLWSEKWNYVKVIIQSIKISFETSTANLHRPHVYIA